MNNFTLTSFKASILRKGSFTANVLTLMTGTTLSQILGIVIAPVLTRLYSPEDFGILALFIAISNIFVIMASWRYEMAIMLPHDHEDAAAVFSLSAFIVIFMSFLFLVIVALFRQSIAGLLKTPEITYWLWCTPVNIFLLGLVQIFNSWQSRMKNFSKLAATRLMAAVLSAGTSIGMGIWGHYGAMGLIAGQLAGSFFSAGILGGQIFKKDSKFFGNSFSRKNIIHQARTYYRFPLIDSWAVVANYASQRVPILILNYFFNNVIVGLYFLGYRVLHLPLHFINRSLSEVFYQRYEEKRKSYGKKDFLKRIIKILTVISFFPAVLLFVFAPLMFKIFFGAEWEVAGEYARILTPLLFFRFISSPIGSVLWSEGKNTLRLGWQCLLLIVSTVAFIIGGLSGNIYIALIIFSICGSLLYLLHIIIVLRVSSY